MIRQSLSLVAAFVVALSISSCSTLFPSSSEMTTSSSTPTGCSASTKHVAPGGYYVNGNTVCTADGRAHLFHGVDRPSLEWQPEGDHIAFSDFQLMATAWKANVVRIALNQDFWLPGSQYSSPSYPAQVDQAVHWAEDAGLDVILDLHWSDRGILGSCNPANGCQQAMADSNSLTFWSQVATTYAGDGRVLFELYNEPHDVPWNIWQSGGTSDGFQVAGMQQLYDTVRAAHADNLVVIGGLSWAYDLSGVPAFRIQGYNITYATHPYNNSPASKPAGFDSSWGFLTATDPVIVTEFGDGGDCASGAMPYTDTINTYVSAVVSYADQHNANYTAWAWYPGGCKFPALINDWTGAPTPPGLIVQTDLLGFNDPAPGGKHDAGTFDAGGTTDGATPADGGQAPTDGGKSSADGGVHDGAAAGG